MRLERRFTHRESGDAPGRRVAQGREAPVRLARAGAREGGRGGSEEHGQRARERTAAAHGEGEGHVQDDECVLDERAARVDQARGVETDQAGR